MFHSSENKDLKERTKFELLIRASCFIFLFNRLLTKEEVLLVANVGIMFYVHAFGNDCPVWIFNKLHLSDETNLSCANPFLTHNS